MANLTTIGDNTLVTLHFSLGLEDGELVDSTFGKQAAKFEYGDGQLPEGFQAYLQGMKAGDKGEWQVAPEKAFGMKNPNNVQAMKRSDFADDMELSQGLMISFADANKSELPGVVASFDDSEVIIDFNHPLAGETLTFIVEILDVQSI